MPTNNDLLSDIADEERNTKSNNQLLQIIANNGGGGNGSGLKSQTLTEDVVIEQNGHVLSFESNTNDNIGLFSIINRNTDPTNLYGTRIDVQPGSIQIFQFRGAEDAAESQSMLRVESSGVILSNSDQTGGNSLFVDKSNVYISNYPDTRDDSFESEFPRNFLYTDASGILKSAPNVQSGTTEERPFYVQDGVMYFDTTLSKPIWSVGAGAGWVDAMGTEV